LTATLPLADAPRLRREALRTRALRLALALVVTGATLGAVFAARHPHTTSTPYLPPGTTGVVALDMSASISTDTFQQVGDTLARLAASGGRYGLVVFSSSAYEALPPGTPARELEPLVRYFRVAQQPGGYAPTFPTNPWTEWFSAGTRISAGLDLARRLVEQARGSRPWILLVSDLSDDPGDLRRVALSALALRRANIPVRVVALSAQPSDEQLFARLLGARSIRTAPPPGTRPAPPHAPFPVALVVLAAVAAAALGAFELFFPTLRFAEVA
jgi:hypothetical protein